MIIVSRNVTYMQIFDRVPRWWDIKRQCCCRR